MGCWPDNQNNTRQRTELLILITPHVIHDQRDARALTDDLRDQLINAAAVPGMLNSLRPSGQSDPVRPAAQATESATIAIVLEERPAAAACASASNQDLIWV